jgi:hypothetical protein
MLKRATSVVTLGVILSAGVLAQTPKPASPPGAQTPVPTPAAERPQPAARREPAQLTNIRIELTITDQMGPGEPARKVVTMHVADQHTGSIRTRGWIMTPQGRRDVVINVDASPTILKDGAVRVDLGLEYQPTGPAGSPARPAEALSPTTQTPPDSAQTTLNERISTILESGKPLVISQAADPASDRRISVEARATVVR